MSRAARSLRTAVALAALALSVEGAAGCKGCRDDHPYVPYSIADAPAATLAGEDASAVALDIDAGAFHPREATVAPPDTSRWALEGLDLLAPPGQAFALGLAGDFDGDGVRDAIAWLERAGGDAGTDPGQVVEYRGAPDGRLSPPVVLESPQALASGADCGKKRRLAQVGRHSILVESGLVCEHASSVRTVTALGLASDGSARLHFRATVLDPADAPALSLDVDGADRDGDGLDDVALRVSVEGGAPPFEPGPKVSVMVRWFDRPAGMSRDPDEPEASLRALASAATARAARAKDAPSVPRYVEQIRALYRALCAEGGSPRIIGLVGSSALSCGASKGLEEAGLAQARAYAVAGDVGRAIAALERAQLPPATKTAARTTDAQAWITQAAPATPAPTSLRAVGAIPQIERGSAPAWGTLAFEASGKLLVRTTAGVVRMDPVQGDEAAADGVAAWRAGVVSPDGAFRWAQAIDACDGFALRAVIEGPPGTDPRELRLPVAAPLGARCSAPRGEAVLAQPVAWGARGLEGIVAGEPILFSSDLARALPEIGTLEQPVTLGAPRSPNGRVLVSPTSMGILVRGARSRLLRARELDGGYAELRDCAVSDDGTRVACVRGGRAFVGVWEAE